MIGSVNQPPIGSLADLTTTDKTNIVAAINEVAAASLDLSSRPNGESDLRPHNLEILPGQGFGGLRKRWADNSTKLERISGDTDNPFLGIDVALAERHAIRRQGHSHDEAGLKEDDAIHAAATVRGASGSPPVYLLERRRTGGTPTSLGYTQVTLDGSVQTITKAPPSRRPPSGSNFGSTGQPAPPTSTSTLWGNQRRCHILPAKARRPHAARQTSCGSAQSPDRRQRIIRRSRAVEKCQHRRRPDRGRCEQPIRRWKYAAHGGQPRLFRQIHLPRRCGIGKATW